jgi:MCP family monocarboxylic acid transporter-like MFS transporter 10
MQLLLPIGTFCIAFAQMMLSITQPNQTYQYFLSQGLAFGIGSAMVFTPALAIVSHYFRKNRGYAFGFVACGSSVGGLIFPIVYQRLFQSAGFGWSVRTTAFICLACLVLACLILKTRLPLKPTTRRELLQFVDLGGFRDPRYCCAAASAFFTFYAIFIPYFYIKQYAEAHGMSANLSQYLLPIINAATVPSRLLCGFVADKTGPLNLMVPMTIISGIISLALWLPSSSNVAIILYAIFYGLLSGQFVSLLPTYIAKITPQPIYGARLGTIYMVVAIANLVGTPTGGGIVQGGSKEDFRKLIGFTGAMVTVGGLFMGAAWVLEARKVILSRRRRSKDDGVIMLNSFRF